MKFDPELSKVTYVRKGGEEVRVFPFTLNWNYVRYSKEDGKYYYTKGWSPKRGQKAKSNTIQAS